MRTRTSVAIALLSAIAFLFLCLVIIPPAPPLKFSGAMQALQFWTAQRAYPNSNLDDRRYHAAYQKEVSRRAMDKRAISASAWTQIGPHNIGGRTLAVALNPLNPKTIFAGSASGGLWRSYTEGKGVKAWEYIQTGFPVLSVSSIAVAPSDSNLMFIGTGEVYGYQNAIGGLSIRTTRGSYGIGILKTTNGGQTWSKSLDWQYDQLTGVQAVRIHPQHVRYVWAATTEGIYKSLDTGRTWNLVHAVVMGTDIILHPTDTSLIFAAHGNLGSGSGGIYRSTNSGATWTKLSGGLPAPFGGKILLAMYAASPNVLYASVGGGASSGSWLCRSTNSGDTWTIVSTTDYASYQGWYSHFVGVHPADSSKIICGGVDLWKSTAGGLNLQKKSDWAAWYFGTPLPGEPEGPPDYSHADHHSITYHPTNPDIIYFGNDGGVFCSTDGGETFEGRNGGYQTTQFYSGFSSSWTDSLLAIGGMQDNATAIYEGTVAWRRVIGGDGCMTGISPTNNDTMYGTSQNLNLLRSLNRGITWSGIGVPSGGQTNFVAPFAIAPSAPKIMYAGREKIFKSTTGGGNWVAMNGNAVLDPGNPIMAIAVAPSDPNVVYATTTPRSSAAKMFRSTNGGTSWTNITNGLPDRYMIDIAVHPTDWSIVYVTCSGFGSSHLFTSRTAGSLWIDVGVGLPDVPTSAVVLDPDYPQVVYVGNDLGVYVSKDDGAQWSPCSEGLNDAALIMDLSISRSNRTIRAVTHGNGVYQRELLSPAVSVENEPAIPTEFSLSQNYPNPFNPVTTIEYAVGQPGYVSLKIYDAAGTDVATLVNEYTSPGRYKRSWNASHLASGTYFCTLTAGGKSVTKKMLLVK